MAGVFYNVVYPGVFSGQNINPVKIGRTGHSYAWDSEGVILAHPHKDIILSLNMNDCLWANK